MYSTQEPIKPTYLYLWKANETHSLIEKIGIKWEENIKNYYKNTRPVQTASLLQVRGSIKKNTSEEWKKYRDHLKIMQETLDSAKIKY